ncbi:Phosphoesterase family domain containing protein [Amanita muscaria]
MHTLMIALSVLSALSSVSAQAPFVSGSPVILSAYPSATAAAFDNDNKHGAPNGKAFKYFMQIWLENQDYSTISNISYYQSVAKNGIALTNYNAITHPSEPNYVAETTVFDLLEAKGLTWKAYNEMIPAPGWTGFSAYNGAYVRKHNPAIIFDNIGLNQTRSANVVSGDRWLIDVNSKNVPAYSFYTPNITNDGHNTNGTFAGQWLDGFLKVAVYDKEFYKDALILITFDENETSTARNQVWAALIGGAIPKHLQGTTDNTFYTHYSAIKTVELNWGLGSLGRGDADPSLSNVFAFSTKKLHYENVNVYPVPYMNDTITGLMTGKSYNETSSASPATST